MSQIIKHGSFDVVEVAEVFTFRATDAENRLQGLEYEVVLDKDGKPSGKIRRKPESVNVIYPLLSNFGIAAEFDLEKVSYKDKISQLLFNALQTVIYSKAQALVSEGKSFQYQDLDLETIANEEPAKKGRRGEIDAQLLEQGISAYTDWLGSLNKPKQVIAFQALIIKSRFKNAITIKPELLGKVGEALTIWFASLDETTRDQHQTFFEFCDGKIKEILEGDEINLEDLSV